MHRRGYRSDWRTRPAKRMISGMTRLRLIERRSLCYIPDRYNIKVFDELVGLYTASSFAVAMQGRYLPEKVFTNAVCDESSVSIASNLRQILQELKDTMPARSAEDEIFEHMRLISRRIEYRLLDGMMRDLSLRFSD